MREKIATASFVISFHKSLLCFPRRSHLQKLAMQERCTDRQIEDNVGTVYTMGGQGAIYVASLTLGLARRTGVMADRECACIDSASAVRKRRGSQSRTRASRCRSCIAACFQKTRCRSPASSAAEHQPVLAMRLLPLQNSLWRRAAPNTKQAVPSVSKGRRSSCIRCCTKEAAHSGLTASPSWVRLLWISWTRRVDAQGPSV